MTQRPRGLLAIESFAIPAAHSVTGLMPTRSNIGSVAERCIRLERCARFRGPSAPRHDEASLRIASFIVLGYLFQPLMQKLGERSLPVTFPSCVSKISQSSSRDPLRMRASSVCIASNT